MEASRKRHALRTVAFVPIKLSNQRLPGKNLLPLAGKPLCAHVFETLLSVEGIDEVIAYCSDPVLRDYIPEGVTFLKRSEELDGDLVKGAQIYRAFLREVDADVYVLAHATSPFIKADSVRKGIEAVTKKGYDSAFAAERIQTFVWFQGEPLNYRLNDVPRTQDIEPVWVETSAFYVFRKEVFEDRNRRIGDNPFLVETEGLENVDIDEPKDYEMAKMMVGDQESEPSLLGE